MAATAQFFNKPEKSQKISRRYAPKREKRRKGIVQKHYRVEH